MNLYYLKDGLVLGRVVKQEEGYRWIPFTSARRPSRKGWPTPEAALQGRVRGGQLAECPDFKFAKALAECGALHPCPRHPYVLRTHSAQTCPRCEAEIDAAVMPTINEPALPETTQTAPLCRHATGLYLITFTRPNGQLKKTDVEGTQAEIIETLKTLDAHGNHILSLDLEPK